MLTEDVVRFFGTKAEAARQLGLTRGAITNWGEKVPQSSAWRVERATKGKLKVNPKHYPTKQELSA